MGFHRVKPESLNAETKRISIEFCLDGQNREKRIISDFVDQIYMGITNPSANIDDWRVLSTVDQSTRRFHRVKFNSCYINAITVKANTNKVVKVRCELIDLSAGGACIAIPKNLKVTRRIKANKSSGDDPPNIKVKFDFLHDIIVRGVIRSLKSSKVDSNLDIDNYDFEYTLPQYWKIGT